MQEKFYNIPRFGRLVPQVICFFDIIHNYYIVKTSFSVL